ncbi:hypothetical protein PtB15_11B8 [Puccinia triticina]|nr:hypothetical protein PtB15_11B8 [Puccinia triticina]
MNNSTTPTNGIVVTPEMWQQMQSMLALFQTAKSAPAPASLDQQPPAKASNQPSQITSASNLYCNLGSQESNQQESDDKSALDNSGFKNKKKESTAPPNKQSTPIIDTQVSQSPSSKKDQDLLVISDLKSYDFSEAAGIKDSVLAIEDAPAIKDAPASEDASDSENLPASKHAPAIEDTPDIEDAAAIQENEASPSEEAVKKTSLNFTVAQILGRSSSIGPSLKYHAAASSALRRLHLIFQLCILVATLALAPGATLWLRGQQTDCLSLAGLGYLLVFDALGAAHAPLFDPRPEDGTYRLRDALGHKDAGASIRLPFGYTPLSLIPPSHIDSFWCRHLAEEFLSIANAATKDNLVILVSTCSSSVSIHNLLRSETHIFSETLELNGLSRANRREILTELIKLKAAKSGLEISRIKPDALSSEKTKGYLLTLSDVQDLVNQAVHQAIIRSMRTAHQDSSKPPASLELQDFESAQSGFVPISLRNVKLQKSKEVEHVAGIIGIAGKDATLILRYFGWNKDLLMEKYMDSQKKVFQDVGIWTDLELNKPLSSKCRTRSTPQFECKICFNNEPGQDTIYLHSCPPLPKDKGAPASSGGSHLETVEGVKWWLDEAERSILNPRI